MSESSPLVLQARLLLLPSELVLYAMVSEELLCISENRTEMQITVSYSKENLLVNTNTL